MMNEREMFQYILKQERKIDRLERKILRMKHGSAKMHQEHRKEIRGVEEMVAAAKNEFEQKSKDLDIDMTFLQEKIDFVKEAFSGDYKNYAEVKQYLKRCGVLE